MAAVRYRYKGKFVSEARAKQLSRMKHASEYVKTERVRRDQTTQKLWCEYLPPQETTYSYKRPAPSPPPMAPAARAKPPVAPTRPAPEPEEEEEEDQDQRFQSHADAFDDAADEAGRRPDEYWPVMFEEFRAADEVFRQMEEPSDKTSDRYDEMKERLQNIMPDFEDAGFDPWNMELFGFEYEDLEDEILADFDVMDIDEDKYKGGK